MMDLCVWPLAHLPPGGKGSAAGGTAESMDPPLLLSATAIAPWLIVVRRVSSLLYHVHHNIHHVPRLPSQLD